MSKIFLYAEYQAAAPFSNVDWDEINAEMKEFKGLVSKTWLSGVNTKTIGGFYEFENQVDAQAYIDKLLTPYSKHIGGNLTVKLFDGEIVKDASLGMNSPFYTT